MGVGAQYATDRITLRPERYIVTIEGLKHVAANCGLAIMFFIAAIPGGGSHLSAPADIIWSVGMALTGIFCVFRPAPSAVLLDWRAVISGLGAFVLPAIMTRTKLSTAGFAYGAAITFEFLGVAISQIARVYMGHCFAVLPANRGIVSNGPFRFVRHPVYLGWVLLAMGFSSAYPSVRNLAMLAVCMALTFWRISLEEELLSKDPEYRAYLSRVHYRMVPGVY